MNNLLEIRNLRRSFTLGRELFAKGRTIRAVDGVSFNICEGETLGLVGESGSGKTTLGRAILQLCRPDSGSVTFRGEEITGLDPKTQKALRRKLQYIFQDPYSSLDPRMTSAEIIAEPLRIHGLADGKRDREEKVLDLLDAVGLGSEHAGRYPRELSGGQRQRIGIARALAVSPEFIVCDEPVSSLDASVRAQILNLLTKTQRQRRLTYFFVSHDLAVVRYISDRVGVIYLGRLMELAKTQELFERPAHPYTRALISSIPGAGGEHVRQKPCSALRGEAPSSFDQIQGCVFRARCPRAERECGLRAPEYREISPGRFCACHFAECFR